jgi:hypothetical protein
VSKNTAWLVVALFLLLEMWWGMAEARNPEARAAFVRSHPCPSTGKPSGPCYGYVVDHVVPLACGGPDAPENMQWQTIADSCEKDKWELRVCGKQFMYRPGVQCGGWSSW